MLDQGRDQLGVLLGDLVRVVHENGVVTDSKANTVYADAANVGKLTTKAVSNTTATVDPLKALDAALSKVDKLRSSLGAVQNRFDSVISNLGTAITNLSSSRSRIEDADYATEVSNMKIHSDEEKVWILIKSYKLYLQQIAAQDSEPILDFTRAYTMVRFFDSDM